MSHLVVVRYTGSDGILNEVVQKTANAQIIENVFIKKTNRSMVIFWYYKVESAQRCQNRLSKIKDISVRVYEDMGCEFSGKPEERFIPVS